MGRKEFGGELGGSWQLLLQKAGSFLNGTRILWGDKTKNLNVNNMGTIFFQTAVFYPTSSLKCLWRSQELNFDGRIS